MTTTPSWKDELVEKYWDNMLGTFTRAHALSLDPPKDKGHE